MFDENRIGDLVVQWGQVWEQGQELSIDELCQDHPELKDVVTERVQSVKAMSWLNQFDDDSDNDFLHLPDFGTLSDQTDELLLPECSLSVDEFATTIVESGLIDADEVQLFIDNYPAKDARSLARQLVNNKKLTRFQATVLMDGREQPMLLDRYIILDEIGSGGMGAVFKALHRQMDRIVALKILPKAAVDSPDKVKRFHREVRAAAKLEHPNIVTAFDAHESKGIHYLVMSYVNGHDLAETVRQQGPLPVGKAVNYITQAARGLEHAHEQGICHRDVKPANLLLDKRDTVKILDMGLARIETAEAENEKTVSQELTQAGAVMGTVAYIAPEQALDTRTADARSDIYALGCTLYYLLNARPVFSEDTMIKTIIAHQQNVIPPLGENRDDVPEELNAVFRKMVAKNPNDRYQSMTDVISALDSLDIIEEENADATAQIGVQPKSTHETMTFVDTSQNLIEAKHPTEPPKRRWTLIAAGLLGIMGLVWAAGILLKVDTPEGTIIVEIDQPELAGAVVSVDGQKKVTITAGAGKEPIEVVADKKMHTLKITKGGFETFTKQFTVKAGGKQTIRVRLEKSIAGTTNTPMTDREVAEWVIGLGGSMNIDGKTITTIEQLPAGPFLIIGINLGGASMKDDDLKRLAGLRTLQSLNLESTLISDTGLQYLKDMQQIELTYLDVMNTKITDQGLTYLKEMPTLKSLNIGKTAVTNVGLKSLQEMKQLVVLTVSVTQIGDVGLGHLEGLTNLERLEIYQTQITDTGLKHLRGMSKLQTLLLGGTGITDAGLERLVEVKNLADLDFTACKITDSGLQHLHRLTKLETLGLSGTKVTPQGIANLKKALQKCEVTGP